MSVERAKQLVWEDRRGPLADDVEFHGPSPVGSLDGREAVCSEVFDRIETSLRGCRSDPYVFLGGTWNGQTWVAETGDMVGEFVEPLFGVPRSRGEVRLRYGVFHRVLRSRIVEVRMLLDIVGLASQAGVELLPPFGGRDLHPPSPRGADGRKTGPQDPVATAETLQLVEDMLGGCNRLEGSDLASMGMSVYWHDDMRWYGPWGIGSTHGFEEFGRHAQGPSVASFPNRRGGFHQARIADGNAAAFTGWPSLQGTFNGAPFRGIEPTGGQIGQNIMDFYVRRGDRLYENWVLIDLVDFASQCGVDLLEPLRTAA